jgi:HlyD family secretion protein
VEQCTLTSPIDGVVLNQALRMGELAAPAAPILTLANLGEVTLEVYVPENRVGHVYLGQPVQVTVDSFPARVFEGQVSGIGSSPEFTPRNVATAEERLNTFYAVEIQLSNPEGLLKPGMPADAVFGSQ